MRRRYIVAILIGGFMSQSANACPSAAEMQTLGEGIMNGESKAIDAFRASPECFDWMMFYSVADQLAQKYSWFSSKNRDEAVRWMYVGQLRGTVAASFDPDPSSSSAALGSMNFAVGQPLVAKAKKDPAKWLAAIDWALDWDKQHPMTITQSPAKASPEAFAKAYEKARASLTKVRDAVAAGVKTGGAK
jgi:hypothetical protein